MQDEQPMNHLQHYFIITKLLRYECEGCVNIPDPRAQTGSVDKPPSLWH
jgi:hypothetical protein